MQHIKPKISIHVSRFFDRCIYVHSHNRHEFNGSDSRLLGQMYSSLSNSGYSIYLDDECFHRDAGTTGNLRTPTVNDLLRIRHACSSDVDSLTRIRREAILRLASEQLGSKGARDWANSATSDRVQRAIEEHLVGVAELSGQPVGWVEVPQSGQSTLCSSRASGDWDWLQIARLCRMPHSVGWIHHGATGRELERGGVLSSPELPSRWRPVAGNGPTDDEDA